MDPAVDGDVVDLDPTLTEEFLDVSIGEPVPQIPAQGEDDDLRWEPEALERRTRHCRNRTRTVRSHPATLTDPRALAPTQQCHLALGSSIPQQAEFLDTSPDCVPVVPLVPSLDGEDHGIRKLV